MSTLICRSMLYMPASNSRALEKAPGLACDAVAIDLEDSVAETSKKSARAVAANAIKAKEFGNKFVVLRINSADTAWYADDLQAVIHAQPDAVLLPKVESASTIQSVAVTLAKQHVAHVGIWAMIETPAGINQADNIAAACAAHSNKAACCLGNNDLSIAANMQPATSRKWLLPWMMNLLLACKTHQVHCLDGVFNHFKDTEGFLAECNESAEMGFDGKTLIHPNQIDAANQAFSPSTQLIDEAKAIVSAFELTENLNKSAIQINGKMVERLHLHWAQRLLLTVADSK